MTADRAMWVFGYGSLLWNPGFSPVEAVTAHLAGYARSFCMLSIHHRGTKDRPGLVLALDAAEGASCTGVALRVAPEDEARVLAELRERELISSAYLERQVALDLEDGRRVEALAYVVDPAHVQYCVHDLETQAAMIARAIGGRGPNDEYLARTVSHLVGMGIEDPDLIWLERRVRELKGTEIDG